MRISNNKDLNFSFIKVAIYEFYILKLSIKYKRIEIQGRGGTKGIVEKNIFSDYLLRGLKILNPFKGDNPDIYIYIRDGNPNTKIHNPTKFLSIFF